MKKKFTIFFLLIYLTLSLNSVFSKNINSPPHCTFENKKNLKANSDILIKSVNIEVKNIRNWSKNSLRILIGNFRWIPDEYKKRFKANVVVEYKNGLRCNFKATIRHHGDQKDHIELSGNAFSQSIDVHLKTGNIEGITKFKLLRPQTRGKFEDEIFINEILRSIGYLSPRTKYITTNINGLNSKMIFQEKIAKELLEYNLRREGPLLEGDERFVFRLGQKLPDNQLSNFSIGMIPLVEKGINAMLAKQLNSQLISKSINHKKISLEALDNLNLIYLLYSNSYKDNLNNFYYFDYDLDNNLLGFNNSQNILKLDTYNLLIQAVNGQHGLAPSNRKFYWNSIENYFEPITYDSNIDLSAKPAFLRLPLSSKFESSFKNAKNILNNINVEKIEQSMKKNGVSLKRNIINEKIILIKKNIELLEVYYKNMDTDLINHNLNKTINENLWSKYYSSLSEVAPNTYIVKFKEESNSKENFEKCNLEKLKCENFILNLEQELDLLEGALTIKNKEYQYVGYNLYNNEIKTNNLYKNVKIDNSSLYYNNGIDIDYSEDKKILNINQRLPGARAFFLNGNLNNLEINFNGYDHKLSNVPNFPIDKKNLTGCLTLVNLDLKDIVINSNHSSCEDSLNLINVTGNLKTINISNSYMDALDIDFSNVSINDIKINNANNDCVDLSFGKYKIKSISANRCGDKSLSVGEQSELKLENLIAYNSNIGVASKDSSVTDITEANLDNLKTCLSAYNKKQEFNGSLLIVGDLNCSNYTKRLDIDDHSNIIVKKGNT